jgi:hypothetical protein
MVIYYNDWNAENDEIWWDLGKTNDTRMMPFWCHESEKHLLRISSWNRRMTTDENVGNEWWEIIYYI